MAFAKGVVRGFTARSSSELKADKVNWKGVDYIG